jgi:queuine tRNA-ribosyltransferase
MTLFALATPHGELPLPAFLPDATRGVVRAVDSADLEAVGIQGLVMSAFHLMRHPGSSTVKALGGLHAMTGWSRPIVTDSGGFQAYSMIRQNARFGSLTDRGIVFRPDGSTKVLLTPEKSVRLQLSYDADVVICLDDCTHPEDTDDNQRDSVRRTIAWARRCRTEFDKVAPSASPRPLLFGVIQGGGSRDLRKRCAEALLDIGFDGFGYGGWPLTGEGVLIRDMVAYTRELVPPALPMHALGIGHPDSIVECAAMGYTLFDSALPTRDARRGRLMAFRHPPREIRQRGSTWWSYVYVADDKHVKSDQPLDPDCDCPTCRRYSRGYLHHLLKVKDAAYLRMATMHNLRFVARLMDAIRSDLGDA